MSQHKKNLPSQLSFALFLQPRRNDRFYLTFFYFQFGLHCFGWIFQNREHILDCVLLVALQITLLLFAIKVRRRMARKSDVELSDILTERVLKGGLIGLAQVSEIERRAFILSSSLSNSYCIACVPLVQFNTVRGWGGGLERLFSNAVLSNRIRFYGNRLFINQGC